MLLVNQLRTKKPCVINELTICAVSNFASDKFGVDHLDSDCICFALNFVELGFFDMSFTGIERREAHMVKVGTISGTRLELIILTISLQRITAVRIIFIE